MRSMIYWSGILIDVIMVRKEKDISLNKVWEIVLPQRSTEQEASRDLGFNLELRIRRFQNFDIRIYHTLYYDRKVSNKHDKTGLPR